jgi:transposase InsO family protein
METNQKKERLAFVRDVESGHWSMTELCERYGVSRPTGYKWLARYEAGDTLTDRSRAPAQCPHRTSAAVEALLVAARRQYRWGAKKLLHVLRKRHPQRRWPARSTVNAILARHQLLRKQRRQRSWAHPGSAPLTTGGPNQIWPADFKGQFRLGSGDYCYPLTVTDHFSRRVLVCQALPSVKTSEVTPIFRTLFREAGLPDAIRTDNGAPFASRGIHGLSALNVWWMQLGIVHQRITPAQPQQNGTHERMHRELKRETTRPAASSLRAQQRRFDAFCQRYNHERPHEGIGDQTPSALWQPSPRVYPENRIFPAYPSQMENRRVSSSGTFKWHTQLVFLSHVLSGEDIALEEVEDGVWNVVYYSTLLGKFDERTGRLSGTASGT